MEPLRTQRPAGPSEPLAPFDGWSVQLRVAEYGFLWYVPERAALVTQLVHPNISPVSVHVLHDCIEEILVAHRAVVDAAGGLTFFHDWRTARTYEPGSRSAWLGRIRRRGGTGYIKRACFILHDAPLTRLAGVVLGASQLLGIAEGVELASEPHDALRRYGLTAPTTTRWPGLV